MEIFWSIRVSAPISAVLCDGMSGKDQFFCPCHGGVFDSAGNVVAGPPPEPIEKLPVKVEDGILYTSRSPRRNTSLNIKPYR